MATSPAPDRTVQVGVVGLGYAGRAMVDALERAPRFALRAVADPVRERRTPIADRVEVIAGIDDLLALDELDVVYIATPTPLHREHATAVASSGRHAVVEKPLAATVLDARAVSDAFERAGRVLVVGHSHSYDAPARALRAFVEAGPLGPLRTVHNWCFTDWVRRPRRPADVTRGLGGGVSLRQGAHQFDILRLVAGGLARRLHATAVPFGDATGDAAYSALVEFEGGVTASAVYGGLGGFDSRVLSFGVGEAGESIDAAAAGYGRFTAAGSAAPMFGFTIASFEHGDVVPSPWGLLVHRPDEDVEAIPYASAASGWDAVLDELDAALHGDAHVHTGAWGVATLEMCLAVGDAARAGAPVDLAHQVGTPTAR